MLRKRNRNVQANCDNVKDFSMVVKQRKNTDLKSYCFEPQQKNVIFDSNEVAMEEDLAIDYDYDYDKECINDPNAFADYVNEIFIYLRYREQFFKVRNYFSRQRFVNAEVRMKMIDWLVEVQETFELNHETLYLAVKLLDIYLDQISNVPLDKFQLISCAAVFVASKFDERSPPLIDDFVYLSTELFNREEFKSIERAFLRAVKFDLGVPTSYPFLRRYARVTKLDMTTLTLARYYLETSLMYVDFCRVSESLMALACYLVAVRARKVGDWSLILQNYSGYKLEQVEPLCIAINHMAIRVLFDTVNRTIYNKYSHEVFFKVALIPALPDMLPPTAPIGPPPYLIADY